MRFLIPLSLSCAALFAFVACSEGITVPNRKKPPPSESLVREAFKAATDSVKSGQGTGKYLFHEQTGDELVLKEEATAKFWFKESKYNVELTFQTPSKHLARKIIVCDGTSIMHSTFWRGIPHPTGAEGYLQMAEGDVHRPENDLFPWDVSCLPKQVLSVEAFLSQPPHNVVWSQNGKIIRGSSEVNEVVVCEFAASEDFGFNVFEFVVRNKGDKDPTQVVQADWKKVGDHWYIEKIVEKWDLRQNKRPLRQWTFQVATFTPNADVPAGKFNLDSLELPENSRILDQRPDAPERSYHYVRTEKVEARLEGLLEQVRRLPTRLPPAPEPKPNWQLRRGLLFGLGGLSLLWLSIGLVRWRRRRRTGGRSSIST
jgi:hypothetical protein